MSGGYAALAHLPLVRSIAAAYSVPGMTADDLAQEGYLWADRVLRERRPTGDARSYLAVALHRRFRHLLRRALARLGCHARALGRRGSPAAPPDPARAAELAEVWRLVRRLPPAERRVVRLRYRDYRAAAHTRHDSTAAGLSAADGAAPVATLAEAAARLGLSRQRVHQIERRALARLRAWLAG